MNLDEMLTQSAAELETAEADLRAAQERVTELRTIQEGMRLALQRYGQAEPMAQEQRAPTASAGPARCAEVAVGAQRRSPPRRSVKRGKPPLSQSDLCLQILASVGRAMSSAEVRQRTEQAGYPLNAEQVRAAFAYLLRKERVIRVEAGVWNVPSGQAKSLSPINGLVSLEATDSQAPFEASHLNGSSSRSLARLQQDG